MAAGRILVIDDEEDIRDLATKILRSKGYEVVTASDGPEGIEKCSGAPFDLILLDINLPGMDGRAVFNKLISDEKTKNVPIIMITVSFTTEDIVGFIEKGARDYFIKGRNFVDYLMEIERFMPKASGGGNTE